MTCGRPVARPAMSGNSRCNRVVSVPMQRAQHRYPIDRMSAAESVLALIGRLDVEKFPPEERMAVAIVEIEAIDEWLAACLAVDAPRGLRLPWPAAD